MKTASANRADEIETRNTTSVVGAEPFLRCLRGEFEGLEVPIPRTGILIGRDPAACRLVYAKTMMISRYHCKVTYSSRTGYFVVTDLNSANGVYTEIDQRVEPGGKLALIPGQMFKLCGDDRTVLQVFVKARRI